MEPRIAPDFTTRLTRPRFRQRLCSLPFCQGEDIDTRSPHPSRQHIHRTTSIPTSRSTGHLWSLVARKFALIIGLVVPLGLGTVGCSEDEDLLHPSPPGPQDTVSTLDVFDSVMVHFMEQRGIKAGLLGIMRNGTIVYEKAFGWSDSQLQKPLQPTAMMRLASVTKPFTAAAIRKLIADGKLKLDDRAFDLGQPGGGILKLEPFPSLGDPRLANITIEHLLQHRGGWDRNIAGDLTYREIQIANAMGVKSPPGRINTVRYILGQPLQFTPGLAEAYSNIGYLVLGLIVEEVSGKDYMSYIYENILDPLEVPRTELIQGRTFPEDRNPREPWYDADNRRTNVFDPTGPTVRAPDGSWDHEARIAQGGLVASTRAVLHFLERYETSGANIGVPRSGLEGPSWRRNHTGSQPGVNTLARQRGDRINFVVFFNKRPSSGTSYSTLIREEIDRILDSGEVIWP